MSEKERYGGETAGYNLVFACSGAADVGAIANQAARQLSRDKKAAMCCTAAIAADIPDILDRARGADMMVVIDGCKNSCAKKILDRRGLPDYAYVALGSAGMEKGKTPVTDVNVARAVAMATHALDRKRI